MGRLPRSHLAVRHTRALLIRAGLRDDEADAFLERLADEFAAGRLETEDLRLGFIERELAEIRENQRKSPGRIEGVITNIASGVASTALYELLKSQLGSSKPAIVQAPQHDWEEIIQIEWADTHPAMASLKEDRPLRRALQIRQERHGTFDKRTAIYRDYLGLFADRGGNHRKAEKLRRQALTISQKVNGLACESTGAAWSNLGLSLFAQRQYDRSEQCLVQGLRVLMDCLGTNHLSSAAAIYNTYCVLHARGRLRHVTIPQQFTQALPQIRELAGRMMTRKMILVYLLALRELLEEIKSQFGRQ